MVKLLRLPQFLCQNMQLAETKIYLENRSQMMPKKSKSTLVNTSQTAEISEIFGLAIMSYNFILLVPHVGERQCPILYEPMIQSIQRRGNSEGRNKTKFLLFFYNINFLILGVLVLLGGRPLPNRVVGAFIFPLLLNLLFL